MACAWTCRVALRSDATMPGESWRGVPPRGRRDKEWRTNLRAQTCAKKRLRIAGSRSDFCTSRGRSDIRQRVSLSRSVTESNAQQHDAVMVDSPFPSFQRTLACPWAWQRSPRVRAPLTAGFCREHRYWSSDGAAAALASGHTGSCASCALVFSFFPCRAGCRQTRRRHSYLLVSATSRQGVPTARTLFARGSSKMGPELLSKTLDWHVIEHVLLIDPRTISREPKDVSKLGGDIYLLTGRVRCRVRCRACCAGSLCLCLCWICSRVTYSLSGR